eukprot:988492-Amphidinium_carterae.2
MGGFQIGILLYTKKAEAKAICNCIKARTIVPGSWNCHDVPKLVVGSRTIEHPILSLDWLLALYCGPYAGFMSKPQWANREQVVPLLLPPYLHHNTSGNVAIH